MSQTTLNIVPGPFASVSSGNCTQTWMLDGDDIQDRANAALDPYWGATATVFCRGVEGYGLQIEGHADFLSVYKTMEDAERARVRALGA